MQDDPVVEAVLPSLYSPEEQLLRQARARVAARALQKQWLIEENAELRYHFNVYVPTGQLVRAFKLSLAEREYFYRARKAAAEELARVELYEKMQGERLEALANSFAKPSRGTAERASRAVVRASLEYTQKPVDWDALEARQSYVTVSHVNALRVKKQEKSKKKGK